MTEAVILALIALVGLIVFGVIIISITKTIAKNNLTHISFNSAYGSFEASFDTKVDE